MIILGIVCLILGFLLGIPLLWTIGIVLVIIGVILAVVDRQAVRWAVDAIITERDGTA